MTQQLAVELPKGLAVEISTMRAAQAARIRRGSTLGGWFWSISIKNPNNVAKLMRTVRNSMRIHENSEFMRILRV